MLVRQGGYREWAVWLVCHFEPLIRVKNRVKAKIKKKICLSKRCKLERRGKRKNHIRWDFSDNLGQSNDSETIGNDWMVSVYSVL
jgi:hypothetical protein